MIGERLASTVGQHVPQVAQRDELPHLHVVPTAAKHFLQQFQARPFPLQRAGQRDEHVQQRGGQRVHVAEILPVGTGSATRVEEDLSVARLARFDTGERLVQDLPATGEGFEDPLLDDRRQVAVLQGDGVEPARQVVHLAFEVLDLGAGDVLADEFGKVTLAGDERHDREAAVGVTRLDQFDECVHLGVDELLIGHVCLQPQDELIEEEDQPVVSEIAGVVADHRQAVLQRDERRRVAAGAPDVGRHRAGQQSGHQGVADRITGGGGKGPVQFAARPAADLSALDDVEVVHVATVRRRGGRRVPVAEPVCEIPVVIEESPLLARVLEHRVRPVDGGCGMVRVLPTDGGDITSQDRRVDVAGTDQVVGHHQELLAVEPLVVCGEHRLEGGLGARDRVIVQDRVQHGQEVALTGTEGAVEVGCVRALVTHRLANHAEGLVEGAAQLVGDHVLVDPSLGLAEPSGQIHLEIAGVHRLRKVEDLPQVPVVHAPCPSFALPRRPRMPDSGRHDVSSRSVS